MKYNKKLTQEYQSLLPFARELDIKIVSMADGNASLILKKKESLNQEIGYIHGGVILTLADAVGGRAAYSMINKSDSIVTSELKLNFLRPAIGDFLMAKASVLKKGTKLIVVEFKIMDPATEELIAAGMATYVPIKETE